MARRRRAPRTFPPVPPADRVLDELHVLEDFMQRHHDREASRERNGRGSSPARLALRQDVVDDLTGQIEADTRPITERVEKYVLRCDEDGAAVGVERPTPSR